MKISKELIRDSQKRKYKCQKNIKLQLELTKKDRCLVLPATLALMKVSIINNIFAGKSTGQWATQREKLQTLKVGDMIELRERETEKKNRYTFPHHTILRHWNYIYMRKLRFQTRFSCRGDGLRR